MSSKKGLLYFRDGELLAQSGEARVYRFMDFLHLDIGPGHNLWAIESELEDYVWQINGRPKGDCLEIGLGLGVASKYILSCPKVKTLTTDFKDKLERIYNYGPDFDPDNFDPNDQDEYYDVLREGDGQIALNLTDITD